MFDAISPSEATLERAQGSVRLSFRRRGTASVLSRHYESGCYKARLPRTDTPFRPQAVLLNCAGGLAGGDALSAEIALEADTEATVTSQAAEKVYRSTGAKARIRVVLSLAPLARLDWLPQETILFDRARLERDLTVEMAEDSELTLVEAVVFGRQAMGETVEILHLIDRWRIRRAGRLIFADALRILGPLAPSARSRANLSGARAVATLLHVAPRSGALLSPLREVLTKAGHPCGVSAWDGMLLTRLAAPDGHSLRRTLVAVLPILCAGRELPRAWSS